MQVKGIQTTEKEIIIDISQDELFRLLNVNDIPLDDLLKVYRSKIIKQLFNITVNEYIFIRDGFFCYSEEHHGSHSWFVTEKIREVTEVEQKIIDALDLLEVIEITYKMEK